MFKSLKQIIVQKTYFLLVLIAPILSKGIVFYHAFGEDMEIVLDGESEHSGETFSSDYDDVDIEEIDVLSVFHFYQIYFDFSLTNSKVHHFLLHFYYICSEQTQPPP
jgi:hypothetical protein